VTAKATVPRISRLVRNDVDATRNAAKTAPAMIAALDTAKKGPDHPPERLARDDPRQCCLADHLAGDEAGISDHRYRQRDRQHLNAGVRELGGARQRTGHDHDQRYPSACGQTAVDERAPSGRRQGR
jgi:hypothetical protein